MQPNASKEKNPVAERLRPVVYLYAAVNIVVAMLLFSTVSPTVATEGGQQVAELR
ncbi:hypothetical protein [Shinella pollutisoli]|uniref:Uncharacterized protein n=1 Tax=Shinella pollutisoli TaxID=2250594 RepID=A0ABV7DNC3_9HYPH|nr:hypothetical protein [Shinella pollutisoli]